TADDLIILVALTRNQHEVAAACLRDCLMNRFSAIRNLAVWLACLLNPLFRVTQNLFRIFSTRIIGSQNHNVAQSARRLAHGRALRTIAIAPTSKYGDD